MGRTARPSVRASITGWPYGSSSAEWPGLCARFAQSVGDRVLEAHPGAFGDRRVPGGAALSASIVEECRLQPCVDRVLWIAVAMRGRGADEARSVRDIAPDDGDCREAAKCLMSGREDHHLTTQLQFLAKGVAGNVELARKQRGEPGVAAHHHQHV